VRSETVFTLKLASIAVCALLGVIAANFAWSWYVAGVQQAVWERQGIHMSRWEVFIGADPAQKSIQILPEAGK